MIPSSSIRSVQQIQSFNAQGNAQYVRFTYFENIALVTGQKEVNLFAQGLPKGAVSNWGSTIQKLPNNISFLIKQIAVKFNANGLDETAVKEAMEKLFPEALLKIEVGEQNFGEFTLGEFLPAMISSVDTGATNVLQTLGDFNAQAVIDLPEGFLIPVEPNATLTPTISFANACTSAVNGAKLHVEFKGYRLSKTA